MMTKKLFICAWLAVWLATGGAAQAAPKVFTCEPEWAALVTELAGADVDVHTATHARQDPHHIEARPSLIARLRGADLLVCTGADLEIGWLPVLLRSAANPRVQPGAAGYFLAADHVTLRDVPNSLDRAQGDIHPDGNPHLHTDPRNIAAVALALAQRLIEIDPARADEYRARHADFAARWQAAIERWTKAGEPLKGVPVAVQHRSWVYLADWLGFEEVIALESKPGVPPSAAHLTDVLRQLRERPAKMVIRAAYQDDRPSQWLSQQTGMPMATLPYTVGGSEQAGDLFALFDDTLSQLLGALR